MQGYKIIDEKSPLFGRIIYKINEYEVMILATPTIGHMRYGLHLLRSYIVANAVQEINLLEEKWIHPHLFKPVKDELIKLLGNE
jgi:hypothetical protein